MDEPEIETSEPLQDVEKVKDLDRVEYQNGFQCHLDGEPFDTEQSPAWQLGWQASARKAD
jgi:hypothetical protein